VSSPAGQVAVLRENVVHVEAYAILAWATLDRPCVSSSRSSWGSLRAGFRSRSDLVLENLALRQQLATFGRATARPMLKPNERTFWVALSRAWSGWRSCLLVVKPATVIAWHRRGYERYWLWRSGKPGRPRIDAEHIAFIRRISSEHPEWGEDRIAEELRLKLGVQHSPSTIRRYMVCRQRPSDGQTWRTFIRNHAKQVFACDFLVQNTALFSAVYIFVVMEIGSRRIVHINTTTSPSLAWVEQQIRQAIAWGETPRFLLHDNDGIFGQYRERQRRGHKGLRYRCQLDVWLADAMGSRASRSRTAVRMPARMSSASTERCGRRLWIISSS
jgi:putative transposase